MAWQAAVLITLLNFVQHGTSCTRSSRLDKFGNVLGDTVVEFSEIGSGQVIARVLGKVSGFGVCPSARNAAAEHALYKAVLRAHSDYDALDDLLPSDGCHPIEPVPDGDGGKVAVWMLRGTCNFVNKTFTAMAAGANAVIIGNTGRLIASSSQLLAIIFIHYV